MNERECVDDFERVMLPHLDAAYKLARWLVRNPAVAEDVVQEAFVRALKYFGSFRGDSGRVWLLQIVRNVSYSTFKSERSRREVPLGRPIGAAAEQDIGMDVPDPGAGPEVTLMHRQELGQVCRALGALPLNLRECIVLRELEGLSYKDIARVTGAPLGTVMSRLSRARQALSMATAASSAEKRLPADLATKG